MKVKFSFFSSLLILCFPFFGKLFLLFELTAFSYLKYFAPILSIMFLFYYDRFNFLKPESKKFFKYYFLLFLVVSLTTIFFNLFFYEIGFSIRNMFNIIIIFSPLIVSIYIIKNTNEIVLIKVLKFFFLMFVSFFLLQLIKNGVSFSSILEVFSLDIFLQSDFETESGTSLFFCFFALYFYHIKNYKFFLLALFLTFLGGKRIAIFGVIIALSFQFFSPYIMTLLRTRLSRNILLFLLVSFCVFIANIWLAVYSREYDEIIAEYTGINANVFFMGRLNRFTDFFYYLPDKAIFLFGYGLGYVENVFYYLIGLQTPAHNDFFRFYLELGVCFFVIWLIIIFNFGLKHKLAFASVVLLLVLMQTDNVIIYDEIMIAFYLIFGFSLNRSNIDGSYE